MILTPERISNEPALNLQEDAIVEVPKIVPMTES